MFESTKIIAQRLYRKARVLKLLRVLYKEILLPVIIVKSTKARLCSELYCSYNFGDVMCFRNYGLGEVRGK